MTTETCKREVEIEVPVDEVTRETAAVTSQFARAAKVPGFRPGKAPAGVIRRRYWNDIRSEVVQKLLPKHFENTLKERKMEAIGSPKFEDLSFEEDKPIKCTATFEVLPEFELGDYQGLETTEHAEPVKEEEIQQTLEQLRERMATFEVVSDRTARDGDFLEIEFQETPSANSKGESSKAKAPETRQGRVELAGKNTLKDFTENLRGAAAGQTREFTVQPPVTKEGTGEGTGEEKEPPAPPSLYRVTVKAIKKKILPELDDDLARSVSEKETLEELKTEIREGMARAREQKAQEEAKEKLIDQLIERHSFPVPGILVEGELERRMQHMLRELMSHGIDPQTANFDWGKLRQDWQGPAEKRVRGDLILEKIARAETIEVSEEELDEKLREISQQAGESTAALKSRLTQEGTLAKLKFRCRQEKALDWIYQSATIPGKGNSS